MGAGSGAHPLDFPVHFPGPLPPGLLAAARLLKARVGAAENLITLVLEVGALDEGAELRECLLLFPELVTERARCIRHAGDTQPGPFGALDTHEGSRLRRWRRHPAASLPTTPTRA